MYLKQSTLLVMDLVVALYCRRQMWSSGPINTDTLAAIIHVDRPDHCYYSAWTYGL